MYCPNATESKLNPEPLDEDYVGFQAALWRFGDAPQVEKVTNHHDVTFLRTRRVHSVAGPLRELKSVSFENDQRWADLEWVWQERDRPRRVVVCTRMSMLRPYWGAQAQRPDLLLVDPRAWWPVMFLPETEELGIHVPVETGTELGSTDAKTRAFAG